VRDAEFDVVRVLRQRAQQGEDTALSTLPTGERLVFGLRRLGVREEAADESPTRRLRIADRRERQDRLVVVQQILPRISAFVDEDRRLAPPPYPSVPLRPSTTIHAEMGHSVQIGQATTFRRV